MLTGMELSNVSHRLGGSSEALLAMGERYLPRGAASVNPLVIREAKGALIEDLEGNIYIDFYAGIGVLNAGHCPRPVVEAIKAQAELFLHTYFQQVPYRSYIELGKKLSDLAPGTFDKKAAFFNSGAEAVENAVKIARLSTRRTEVISFGCSFHGRTNLASSLTCKVRPYKFGCGPFAPGVHRVASAYCYRCPWNAAYPGCGLHCLEQFKTFFQGEVDPSEVAAMIIEPVHGEGGIIVPPKEFLPGLRAICQEHGIVFIADEIQTGFYRTGKPFAVEHFDIAPDLMTCAKSIAAGMPLSAVVGKADVMDGPDRGQIGGTFCGNPLACAAALATLDFYQDQDLGARAQRINQYVCGRLQTLRERHPRIGDVRALGAMFGVEFVKDPASREPDPAAVKAICRECFNHGLIVIPAGIFDNVIRLLMPLVITDDQLAQAMDIFESACAKVLV